MLKRRAVIAAFAAAVLAPLAAVADIPPPYELYGVGLEISEAEPFPEVSAVGKGSPAEKAGVQKGDAVIAIDGTYPKDLPFYYFARSLKGKQGTEVELILLREQRRVLVVKIKRSVRDR